MARLKDLKVTIGLSKKGLSKLNADLRRVKGNFRRNFGEISALVKNAALVIGTTLVGAVGAMIKASANLERVTVGFRSIMGSADGAARMVEKLNRFSATTPFQLEDVSTAARQLLAVGVKESAIESTLRTIGDIAAANGSSITEMSAIYAKAQAKGKIDQEILNQLLDRGINIKSELLKVTGQTGDEFQATSVKLEDFNQALINMASEGGVAADAMKNLSETTDGMMSTFMDVGQQFAAQTGEMMGAQIGFKHFLKFGIDAMNDGLVVSEARVNELSGTFNDLRERALHPTQKTAGGLTEEFDNLIKGLDDAIAHAPHASAAYKRLTGMLEGTKDGLVDLNEQFMDGLPAGADAGAGAGGGGDDDKETLEQFTARFNAAAALTEQQKALAEATAQQIVTDQGLIEAQQGLRDAYGEVGGAIVEVTMAEEELFDEEAQERIVEGERMLRNAALAAANIGAAMSVTSALTNAAFDSIKEGGKSFGESVLAMLESLLKKAIALAAAFAAMSLIGGPGAVKALGSFKSFMMGGMGIQGFADGGLVTGATLAMVGEGPGTSLSNPEVIAPLDKLQSMMGGGNVNVTGVIRGQDILISNERSALDRNRVRGF